MAKHSIPITNWTHHLADTIEAAQAGDTIEVASEDVRELAKRAHQRMCPDKALVFVVAQPRADFLIDWDDEH